MMATSQATDRLERLGRLALGTTVDVPGVGEGTVEMLDADVNFVVVEVEIDGSAIHYTVPYGTAEQWWKDSLPMVNEDE